MVEGGTGVAGASGEAGAEADAPQSVPVGPEYHRMSLADFVSTRSGAAASATAHSDPAAAHTVLCHPLLRERWGAAEHVYEEEAQMHTIQCTGVPKELAIQQEAIKRAAATGAPLQPARPVKPSKAGTRDVTTTIMPALSTASMTMRDMIAACEVNSRNVEACAKGEARVARMPNGGPKGQDDATYPGCVLAIVDRDANVVFNRVYQGMQPPK